jgi:hypothetical protein
VSDDAASDAEQTLHHLRDVRTRTRTQAHGGAWFPVAVIACLLLASIGLYQAPGGDVVAQSTAEFRPYVPDYPAWAGLPAAQRHPVLSWAYWFLATPLAFALIAWWYRRRARARGITVAWRRVLIVGLGGLAALAVLAAMPSTVDIIGTMGTPGVDWFQGLLTPLVPVAVALIALGWSERSFALAATGAWIGLVASWYGAAGLGRLPGWLIFVLNGFEGPALGGRVALFDRPAAVLGAMALPLVVYAAIQGLRSRA